MADRARTLARIHRVRTLQLTLKQGEEAAAQDKLASEAALSARIGQLVSAISPTMQMAGGFSMSAAAHYRDKLSQSATAADARVRAAEDRLGMAAEETKAAKRDQTAVEKLIARAEAEATIRAIRAMEDMPATRKNRHDPC